MLRASEAMGQTTRAQNAFLGSEDFSSLKRLTVQPRGLHVRTALFFILFFTIVEKCIIFLLIFSVQKVGKLCDPIETQAIFQHFKKIEKCAAISAIKGAMRP